MLPRIKPWLLAFFVLVAAQGAAPAQTSYWIARKSSDGTLDYSVKVPDYFVTWIERKTPRGGGAEFTRVVDGKKLTFLRQYFSYRDGNFSPVKAGFISLDKNQLRTEFDSIEEPRLKGTDFSKALEALANPSTTKQRQVDLEIYRHTGAGIPNVKIRVVSESYWIAKVTRTDGRTRSIDYSVAVPDYVVPWLLKKNDLGGGAEVTRTIDGKTVPFIRQFCEWDNGSVCPLTKKFFVGSPAKTGQLRVGNEWQFDGRLSSATEFNAALDAMTLPTETNQRTVELLVYKHVGSGRPSLRFTESVPLAEQMKSEMLRLSARSQAGEFYSTTHVPTDLKAFREAALAIGNEARRDPFFRKNIGAQTSTDFSRDSILTRSGPEKLFKHSGSVPYFKNLVLNENLSRAAQFQAEYQADRLSCQHQGPRDFKGNDLTHFSSRTKFFGYRFSSVEGVAFGSLMSIPTAWIRADTDHYKPWFNVGGDYREIGLGVARGRDRNWYFCYLASPGK